MRRLLATATVLVLSCTSSRLDKLSSRDVVEIGPKAGAVAAKLLEDSAAPEVRLGPDEEFVSAYLAPQNHPPEYPRHLLTANVPPYVVPVRVMFDESGRVISISDSPVASSTHGEYAAHFRTAVEESVKGWRCSPAGIRKFRDGPDGDRDGKADFRVMSDELMLKTFFDLSFVFEIVSGQPIVKSNG